MFKPLPFIYRTQTQVKEVIGIMKQNVSKVSDGVFFKSMFPSNNAHEWTKLTKLTTAHLTFQVLERGEKIEEIEDKSGIWIKQASNLFSYSLSQF